MSRTRVRFGEVVQNVNESIQPGKSHSFNRVIGLEHLNPGDPVLHRWDDLEDLHDGTSFRKVFRKGHVLFGKRRAYQRKVAVAPFDGICSGDILVFSPADDRVLPEFLLYVVQSDAFFSHALQTSSGSLSPRTRWEDLSKYEFELPSLDEQARLVELVSAIEEHVESTQKVRDGVRVLRQLLLSGEVRAQGTQYPQVQLRDLVEILDHMRRPISSDERAGRVGDIPYYGATGRTGWIDDHLFDEDLVLLGEDAVDFVNPTCEKAYFVSGKSWVNNHAHVLRPMNHVIDAKFLVAALNQVDYTRFASFGTRSKLTKSAMMEIELPVPSLQIQKSIVAKLDRFDAALRSLDESVTCARTLQLSILNSELS